ncbi:MAG: Modification methylase PvuII [Firmicutes bacterium ADurb.Bin419]|nr:MAG: Modification methylase PvuII [Firmicutes bacterium ADurb.Bin419]
MNKLYKTKLGEYYIGDSIKNIKGAFGKKFKGKVQLILTSPPFPLNSKKKYGNKQGEEYKKWFAELAPLFADLLAPNGSIIIELGNAWEPGRPVQSLLHLESLLAFVGSKDADLRLCQEFICYNPSRLPSPAQWVTVNRIRTVDSYTHVWWMSKSDFPKSDNTKILRPYSQSMKRLLKKKKYNSGKRPSEHVIGEKSFLSDNGGSIMHNLLEFEQIDPERDLRLPQNIMSFANTSSNDYFLKACRQKEIKPHPARMSSQLASFFIEFLTDKNDLVFDPFAGSNTTGYCAERLDRKWVSIDISDEYSEQAKIRLQDPELKTTKLKLLN